MSRPKQRKKCHWYGPSSPKPSVLDWWIPCASPLPRQYFSLVFWRSGCFLPARFSSSLADTLNRIAATTGGQPGLAQGGRGGLIRAMWPHVAIKSPNDGLPPYQLPAVLGRALRRAMAEDESILFDDLA